MLLRQAQDVRQGTRGQGHKHHYPAQTGGINGLVDKIVSILILYHFHRELVVNAFVKLYFPTTEKRVICFPYIRFALCLIFISRKTVCR